MRKVTLSMLILMTPLIACASNGTVAESNLERGNAMRYEITDITLTTPGVSAGSTRKDAISVFGSEFQSHTPITMPPFVDSFPYREGEETKFIYVYYKGGLVESILKGLDEPYRVH